MELKVEMVFVGHYAEPSWELVHVFDWGIVGSRKASYRLSIDPFKGWTVSKEGHSHVDQVENEVIDLTG